MENGGRLISNITLYACGSCVNNVASVFKGEKKREIVFPVLVARIEHVKYGVILFDTGYSKRVYENGIISKLYNLLNPTTVNDEDTIAYKMDREGVKVNHIILSHPHPDHIGCLRDFKDYTLIATEECFECMDRARLRDLVFKNQRPGFDIKRKVLEPLKDGLLPEELRGCFTEIYDVTGDGSIYGIRLDGHSKGQIGIYMPEYRLLLAADASWGHYFADRVEKMKLIPRHIQNDYASYKDSISRIKAFESAHPEIKVIYTHEEFPEGIYEQ